MKILIACDKFKGSLSAVEVGSAITTGLPKDWEIEQCPIADGGEGFVDAMLKASGGERIELPVLDALGREFGSSYGVAFLNGEKVAFIEMAAASGLWRISEMERNPRIASTFGTGQMIRHAAEISKVDRIFIGIGGSATNDGGIGMAAALGVRFLDICGNDLEPVPAAMTGLAVIDETGRIELPEIIVACDVDHPLTGLRGASVVFGPQKGATPDDVKFLDAMLTGLAEISGGEKMAITPGAGAAGGLGFGLMRFADAKLVSGFDLVAEALNLTERISKADLVITGEGSLDEQTLGGKGPAGVALLAKQAGKPVVAIAGRVHESARGLFDAVFSLQAFGLPVEESISRAAELVTTLIRNEAPVLERLARPVSSN